MIRQQAFAEKRKMLKGGLHIHTTRSDGKVTPEESIQYYYEQGYHFLALTDHRKYNYKNFRPDLPVTVIPAMEHDCAYHYAGYHTVCLGLSKEEGNGYEQDVRLASEHFTDEESLTAWRKKIYENNNISIYCHPEWSGTPARVFENHTEHFAMEIWNSISVYGHDIDKDASYWDEILGQGKVLYGVAADDTHSIETLGKGWVMVNAENDVKSILDALKNGAFYSSCGPEIYDFYVDGETAVVECSPAAKIRLHSDMHPTKVERSADSSMVHAEFKVTGYEYVRATVIDGQGRYAWTNPIFLDGRVK
ncbi:MAG: PHP domain-containing protein [Clostridia bacterium]|nr:PHP domain-containing protein [Clostridia bacterium]